MSSINILRDCLEQTQHDGYRDGILTEQADDGRWVCYVWRWRCSCGLAIAIGEGVSAEHARARADQRCADEMLVEPPWRHRQNCVPARSGWSVAP